jgi:hypothetical protein
VTKDQNRRRIRTNQTPDFKSNKTENMSYLLAARRQEFSDRIQTGKADDELRTPYIAKDIPETNVTHYCMHGLRHGLNINY